MSGSEGTRRDWKVSGGPGGFATTLRMRSRGVKSESYGFGTLSMDLQQSEPGRPTLSTKSQAKTRQNQYTNDATAWLLPEYKFPEIIPFISKFIIQLFPTI